MFVAFSTSVFFNWLILTEEIKILRNEQVENTFYNYFNNINKITEQMQYNAASVARAGEMFYSLHQQNNNLLVETDLSLFLQKTLTKNSNILGTGIWYEPYKFGESKKYLGPYAFWQNDSVAVTWEYNLPSYDYLSQDWYTIAIPKKTDSIETRKTDFFVTPPYMDKLDNKNVIFITLSHRMYDSENAMLGISSTDWSIEVLDNLLSEIYITPNSFVTMIDQKTGNILYDAKVENLMQNYKKNNFYKNINIDTLKINTLNIVKDAKIEDEEFDIYYSVNNLGFVFVIAVNRKEAYSVLNKVNKINVFVVSVTLFLTALFLYLMITRIMLPFEHFIKIVKRFANFELDVRAKIKRNDEVGRLAKTFNDMADTMQKYSETMEEYNKNLEQKVEARTQEIREKNEELLQQHEELQTQSEELITLTESLSTTNQHLNEQNDELESQKIIIEQHNKSIISSINYARTIQDMLLPTKEYLQTFFDIDIFYLPKDIVSGDFYWLATKNLDTEVQTIFFAIADCTGHGVPGAFMSLIGGKILDYLIYQKNEENPSDILYLLDKEIINTLHQNKTTNSDGMDIGLCKFEKNTNTQNIKLTFAGAKNNIYIYSQSNGFIVFKGDRKNIGGQKENEIKFINNEIILQQGDIIYLATDGFTDQCNDDRKNYYKTNFIKLLQKISILSVYQQMNIIREEFFKYKQNAEQRDDVTVIVLKI